MTTYTDLKARLNYARRLYKATGIDGEHGAQMMTDALAAIEELEARNQWQPIETAPKNTEILVFMDDEIYEAGLYTRDEKREEWLFPMADYHGCGCCSGNNDHPTHWMPLPQPPEQGQ